mmetsp:Transcript_48977/g.114609  ORF Transcript_48977/g.114609 Transcript_48977/m.114609 type:complete len:146 (-) Transcript_48977:5163-5600(-)
MKHDSKSLTYKYIRLRLQQKKTYEALSANLKEISKMLAHMSNARITGSKSNMMCVASTELSQQAGVPSGMVPPSVAWVQLPEPVVAQEPSVSSAPQAFLSATRAPGSSPAVSPTPLSESLSACAYVQSPPPWLRDGPPHHSGESA